MFKGFDDACPHCGKWHTGAGLCPKIVAVEYYENGQIKRVEYIGSGGNTEPTKITPETPSVWEFVNEGKIIRRSSKLFTGEQKVHG